MKIDVIALVLHFDQATDDLALFHAVTGTHDEAHLEVVVALADAVDAGNRGDNHAITPFQQAFGRREAHLFDVFVDRGILFDEEIAGGNVGFRLVVVVVRNEILDGIFRKKLAEFRVKLRRQGLVRGQHQGRTPGTGDDVGHRIGLARAGHAKQGLEGEAVFQAVNQRSNRLRLVTGGQEGLVKTEWAVRIGNESRFFLRGR